MIDFTKKQSRATGSGPNLSSSLEAKLARYALAGSALLSLPAAAHADNFFYSGPLNVSVTQSAPGSNTLAVSFDNTITDLSLMALVYSNAYPGNYGAYDELIPQSPDEATTFSVAPGTLIGPATTFSPSANELYTEYVYYNRYTYAHRHTYSCGKSTCSYYSYTYSYRSNLAYSGPTPNYSPYYVGVEFTRSAQTYYGWIELENYVTPTYAEVELLGYAYNTTPGDSIPAGLTTPEPATLPLYALGAAGILALRRRRRKTLEKA